MKAFLDILKTVALSLLTEKVIKIIVISLLRQLVKSSKNKIDDEIFKEVEKALNEK